MKKALLLALVLALVAGTAGADAEKIGYHAPTLAITGGTLTGALSGTTAFFTGPVSIGNTSASPYANLYGDAANTLALRNGGTAGTPVPQTFNIYNFCDGTNCATGYERGFLRLNSNTFEVGTEKAGTGSNRALSLLSASNTIWFTGYLTPGASDTYTVGTASTSVAAIYISRSIQGSKSKSLTDAAAAVSFVRIAVPTNGNIGGDVIFTATSTDGANGSLTRQGRWSFAGADAAGTVTCGVGTEYAVATAYARANTLVCTMTAVTATTNCDLQITCTDDKAGSQTVTFNWRLNMPLTATLTPQ